MTDTGNDGAIYVGVLPDLRGFDAKLREQARASGLRFGTEFTDTFDRVLGPKVREDLRKAVTTATAAAPKAEIGVQLQTAEAQAKLQKFAAQKAQIQAKVTADTADAQVQIRRLSQQQAKLQAKVDLNDDEAKAKVAALEERKVAIQAKVDADTAGAIAQVAALDRKIHEVDNRRVRVDADTSGAELSISKLIGQTDKAIGSAGGLAGALAAIGPAALPSLAAAAAGALALGSAIGGAAVVSGGAGILAFSGIGDAVKALADNENGASKAAAQAANATQQLAARHLAAAGAADQLRQAQAGLKNAMANAAEATRSADQRVTSAEQTLSDAQRSARQVQLDLTQARKDAAQQLEDLADRVKDASLSQAESTLAIARAKERLNAVNAPGSKATDLDRKEAELALQRAELNADEQSKQLTRLKAQKADADKAGVEGSKQVLDAQQRITDSTRTVKDAEQALAEARHQQAETDRRNAYSVAQARQAIVAAQRSVQSSATQMARVAVPAVDKLHDAMANLSPEGQKFARFLFGLKPGLDDLKATAQAGLLPGLEEAIRTLTPLMPTLKGGIKGVSEAMGDASKTFADTLVSPEVRTFLHDLFTTAPDSVRQLGILAGKATQALATIFDQATPAGKRLLGDVVDNLGKFLDRISTPDGKKALRDFFDRGTEAVEGLGTLLGGVADLFGALLGTGTKDGANTLADTLRSIGGALHALAGFIREHEGSGEVLKGIAAGFVALKVVGAILGPLQTGIKLIGGLGRVLGVGGAASAAGEAAGVAAAGESAAAAGGIAGSLEGIGAALAVLTGPVGLIVAALAALAIGFYFAYTRSEKFRDVVNKAVSAVGATFMWVWDHLIHPALTFMRVEVDVVWAAIQVTFGLFQIGLKLLGQAFMAVYDNYIRPWWQQYVQPLLNTFGSWLDVHVIPKIKSAADVIGGVFGGIADWWKASFSDAIDNINKLLDVYNRVAKTFHVQPDNVHVDNPFRGQQKSSLNFSSSGGGGGRIPTKAATGGHITGPGTGTSDDIPVWLSNGEFVLRSAAVNALGVPFLNLLNRADQLGGVGGDPSQVVLGRPRYADGGLVEQVQRWLPGVDPKPYVWGAVGPGAFDCSGLVGEVWARLTGHPSWHRYMTTSSSMEALGFRRGHGTFTLGLDPGVHVVGNLAGLPFEAANPKSGIHVGSGAQSVDRLPQQWYLPQIGNRFVSAGGSASGGGFDLAALAGAAFHDLVDPLLGAILNIPGASPMVKLGQGIAKTVVNDVLHFDQGGWLQPGTTLVRNDTGKPEAILNPSQWKAVAAGVAGKQVVINIDYPPWMSPEQALVDAQARVEMLGV